MGRVRKLLWTSSWGNIDSGGRGGRVRTGNRILDSDSALNLNLNKDAYENDENLDSDSGKEGRTEANREKTRFERGKIKKIIGMIMIYSIITRMMKKVVVIYDPYG